MSSRVECLCQQLIYSFPQNNDQIKIIGHLYRILKWMAAQLWFLSWRAKHAQGNEMRDAVTCFSGHCLYFFHWSTYHTTLQFSA